MPKVYSYLRFSDPRQAAGHSVERQAEYARRWAAERGLVLDESLSMADHGLSGYHQRHVTHGALGVFLRAVEDGRIEAGSVLVVEGLDRLSRAEPIQAQAQLAQIVQAGITVVTASDSKEYNRARLKQNPMDLVYSLLVMIRAHEESDTKSKRVRAAIRRQCEGWQAGTWRGIIRNGKDPHWVRIINPTISQHQIDSGTMFELVPERSVALRYAIGRFLAGAGAVQIMRELAARGMSLTDAGALSAPALYKTLRKRLLVGEREIRVGGDAYVLPGYYPPLLTDAEFDALQLALDRRQGRRGVGEIPSILTGLGVTVCGYCGAAIVSQNLMGRARQPDGTPQPGHRRLICTSHAKGGGCPAGGSIQAAPVETALMLYSCDRMRMDALLQAGDHGQALRADLARGRRRLADTEARLERLARALAEDDGAAPAAVLRQIRVLEAEAEAERKSINGLERELSPSMQATPDMADRWLELIEGVGNLDPAARMEAREMVRASFSRIVLWHSEDGGRAFDLELTARGGGSMRMRFDRKTGGLISN